MDASPDNPTGVPDSDWGVFGTTGLAVGQEPDTVIGLCGNEPVVSASHSRVVPSRAKLKGTWVRPDRAIVLGSRSPTMRRNPPLPAPTSFPPRAPMALHELSARSMDRWKSEGCTANLDCHCSVRQAPRRWGSFPSSAASAASAWIRATSGSTAIGGWRRVSRRTPV